LVEEVLAGGVSLLASKTGPRWGFVRHDLSNASQLRVRAGITKIEVRNARNSSRVTLRVNWPLKA
jgi:hypothetical protein